MGDLSKDAVLKKWHSFEKAWFSCADTIEDLKGDTDSLGSALDTLADILPGMVLDLDIVTGSMKALAPGAGKEAGGISSGMTEGFTALDKRVGDLRAKLASHREMASQMAVVQDKLAGARREHETLAATTRDQCGEAGEARKTYEAKVSNIKEATNRHITKFRDIFLKDMVPLFEGFTVGKGDSMEDLFDNLVEDPGYHRKAGITAKGIGIGRKKADVQVRIALLDYKGEEIVTTIHPLLEDEARRIAKFQEELRLIEEQEARCAALKDTETEMESGIRVLLDRLEEMKARDTEVSAEFATTEAILTLKGTILETYDATTPARKRMGEVVESSLGSLVEMEADTEKRELKERIGLLTKEREDLASDLERTRAGLGDMTLRKEGLEKDLAGALEEIGVLREETGRQRVLIQEREGRIASVEKENLDLSATLKETTSQLEAARALGDKLKAELEPTVAELEGTVDRFEGAQKEITALKAHIGDKEKELAHTRASMERTGADLTGMTTERDRLKAELQHTMEELEGTVERYEGACQERENEGERSQALEREITALKTDLANTRTELADRVQNHESARSEAAKLRRALDEKSLAHDTLKADHTRSTREQETLRSEAVSTKGQLDRYKAAITDQEHEKEALKKEVQRLTSEVTMLMGARDAAVVEKERLKTEVEGTIGELKRAQGEQERTAGLYAAARREVQEQKDALEAAEKRYAALKKTHDRTTADFGAMKGEVDRLETEMVARIRDLEAQVKKAGEEEPKKAGPTATKKARPRPPKRPMTTEEKKVEKKIEALRKGKS